MNNDEKVARANRASALLKDELLTQAFDQLKSDYTQAWLVTGVRDTDGRERLWHAMQVVGKVQEHLHAIVADGKIAQREIDDLAGKPRGLLNLV